MHWSEELAERIIQKNPDKEEYVCAAGVSPSGSVHIGNFRDIATSLFVVKALEKSPAWTPGEVDGKTVPVRFTLPILFQMR